MATSRELQVALVQKTGFEVVESTGGEKQLRLVGRVHRNFVGQWKLTMHRLLQREASAPWKIDISKKYFLRTGQVYYGWRLIIQLSPDTPGTVEEQFDDIIKTVDAAPSATRQEIMEIALVGASPNRNTRTNVGLEGKVMIGPMAAHAKMMGR